ncbi:ABC transporter ATP-binding protein [Micromonospora costi]|uniref:ABC-type quaternary amine transporter n=1 Tax=Micromonospora costi TaxID=1530042 RepID=A0A3B0A1P1_9ACTN|nr:ATP-binding cassette domain-containing protein [Micromonospora costi]RKN54485.1 ATP-binding cassette domain-containing protein [Micromonospora costi]
MDVTPDTSGAGGRATGDAARAASITLDAVRKRYPDGTEAVRGLSLEIKAGELVVLIGPSGCGKSTVLRMINRLIEPTGGRILLGDEDVTQADPVRLRRRIGYVIQNVGLFPHQTVRANVATVPRLLGWSRDRSRERVDELLELVGLDPGTFGGRYPHELSGGQRQRVGVARALAADPVVLLMDEPFSAVDPIVRTRLQEEFLRLQAEVRKTIVLVTHDLDEAVRLGDRIAVLSEGGHLEQYDSPAALLGTPATPFVREFVGADRGIRRLVVTPVGRDVLDPVPADGTPDAPAVPLGGSAYDALAVMLTSAADRVVVTDEGRPVGVLDRRRLLDLGRAD